MNADAMRNVAHNSTQCTVNMSKYLHRWKHDNAMCNVVHNTMEQPSTAQHSTYQYHSKKQKDNTTQYATLYTPQCDTICNVAHNTTQYHSQGRNNTRR